MKIAESDWKIYKPLWELAQERFSQRVLDECRGICDDESRSAEERHWALSDLLRERDKEMVRIFDSLRRSTAVLCLISMRSHGLVTDEEMSAFSPELQQRVSLE